jgi:Protein of unknown function (DUF1566)
MSVSFSNHPGPLGNATLRMPSAGPWRLAAFWLACAALGALGAWAQSGGGCPAHKALTLTQVLGYISQKIPDERTVQRIEACRVSFPLDAHALDRLVDAGASKTVQDALNRVTISQLALTDAQSQVAELEGRVQEIGSSMSAQRDEALRKLDTEYQPQRERAAHNDPKSDFESTADYDARVRRNQGAVAAMDGKHELNRNDVAAEYADKVNEKERPYLARIAFLKNSTYPDSRAIIYGNYSADTQQLTAVLAGENYRFDRVAPKTAETLVMNWTRVKVTQAYSDDELHTRVLILGAPTISASGYSQEAAIKKQLAEAEARTSRRDYDGAINNYLSVLAMNPNNQAAKDGIAALRTLQQRESALIQDQRAAGEWIDPQTHLMWTLNDNGHDINWKGAVEYCKALRTGGFSDWRLASIEELKGIYDPGSSSNTTPTRQVIELRVPGANRNIPIGTFWPYHIRGGITLTNTLVWGNTKAYAGSPTPVGTISA